MQCIYCNSLNHTWQQHQCSKCLQFGHADRDHQCIYCNDAHNTEYHTCELCLKFGCYPTRHQCEFCNGGHSTNQHDIFIKSGEKNKVFQFIDENADCDIPAFMNKRRRSRQRKLDYETCCNFAGAIMQRRDVELTWCISNKTMKMSANSLLTCDESIEILSHPSLYNILILPGADVFIFAENYCENVTIRDWLMTREIIYIENIIYLPRVLLEMIYEYTRIRL